MGDWAIPEACADILALGIGGRICTCPFGDPSLSGETPPPTATPTATATPAWVKNKLRLSQLRRFAWWQLL